MIWTPGMQSSGDDRFEARCEWSNDVFARDLQPLTRYPPTAATNELPWIRSRTNYALAKVCDLQADVLHGEDIDCSVHQHRHSVSRHSYPNWSEQPNSRPVDVRPSHHEPQDCPDMALRDVPQTPCVRPKQDADVLKNPRKGGPR